MRTALSILLTLTIPCAGSAQTDESRSAKTLSVELSSGDPLRIATAAVTAGDQKIAAVVPALRKALRELERMDHNTALHPSLAVLDALVRLKARVPAKDLSWCLDEHRAPAAMVLMARAPEEYEQLLVRIFADNETDRRQFRWVAAGNLLAKMRSKGFVELLLKRMKITVVARVILPGAAMPGAVGFGSGGGGGGSRSFYMQNYPHFGLYELGTTKREGDSLVAAGEKSIFARRLIPDRRHRIRLRRSWMHMKATDRKMEWVAQLLKTEVRKLPIKAGDSTVLFYSSDRAYRRDLQRIRAKAQGSLEALANRLRIAGLLPETSKTDPRVDVQITVIDLRPGSQPTLPTVEAVKLTPRRSEVKRPPIRRIPFARPIR